MPPADPNRDRPDQGSELLNRGGKIDREALLALYEQAEGDDDAPVTARFVLSRDLNKRLDRYLVDRIPFLSRTSLQRLIGEEAVTVNGRLPKASTRLRRGDVVVVVLPPPPSKDIPAEEIPLDILFEDDDLIVINKQDDIIVHPARGNLAGTIINGLAWHFQHHSGGALSSVGEEFARPGVVHRLDRHTTGVMVAAKSDTAHWRLGHQFEHRRTEKRYLAVVHGRMEPHADVIDLPLGKHPTIRQKYAVRWDETGKPSVTIYRIRELYDGFTLVELELKSGRTHQIRVHLSHLGYPIVGDDMYGGRHITVGDLVGPQGTAELSPREPVITRQALHAAMLGFTHPISNKLMSFQAPLPEDMRRMVRLLRERGDPRPVKVAGATIDLERAISA
ncbi:MAG: RluA family pseudouridine synthase [Phycisphaerales bacterium]|nr:MAG: RluA family pseudouridine synthase [Phycisphaerales bacterium]